MKISGVVVLYNPQLNVYNNILTYYNTIDKLYVCDNSDVINQELIDNLNQLKNVEVLNMNGNQGIACALKKGLQKSIDEGFDFCLTMDQDSIFPSNRIEDIKEHLSIPNINDYGIISLNYNSNSNVKKINDVKTWITSGNYINISNYKLINGFNSSLFIDYVDFDLDEQFYNIHKKIGVINDIALIHTIGEPKKKRILFFKFSCSNHSLTRVYYKHRNSLYLYRKNKKFYKDTYKYNVRNELFKTIIFEDNRIKKIKMILRGRKDAKNGKLGKYEEVK